MPRARGGQLLARLGVGERLGGQLGERAEPVLDARRERLGRDARHEHARPTARPRRKIGAPTAERKPSSRSISASSPSSSVVGVQPRRRRPVDARGGGRRRRAAMQREPTGMLRTPGALQPPRTVAVLVALVADHVRGLGAEQPPDLLGDRGDHLALVGAARDQRRDAVQRGLLARRARAARARCAAVGDVAHEADEQRRLGRRRLRAAGGSRARPGTRCRRRAAPASRRMVDDAPVAGPTYLASRAGAAREVRRDQQLREVLADHLLRRREDRSATALTSTMRPRRPS